MNELQQAAARVAEKRRELEQRLRDLSEAHPLNKLKAAPLVAATFLELIDHQADFNRLTIVQIHTVRDNLECHEERHQDGAV